MGLVLDQRSNITGTLRNKIQVKEKKSEHGDWRLLKDRITGDIDTTAHLHNV